MKRIIPRITRNLIIINALMWLAQMAFLRLDIDLAETLGLHYWGASRFNILQLISYQFLHSPQGIEHLLMNMLSLLIFGATIERFWGGARFLLFYLTCGITAGLVQELSWHYELAELMRSSFTMVEAGGITYTIQKYLNSFITIGASGAVFGLLLAYGMLFPNSYIMVYFLIPIKAKYFVVLYGAIELFYGVHSAGDGVAHFAHLGGMIGGLILILLWRKKGEIHGPYN